MASTLTFSPLSLDLPSTRMSVDFSTLTTDFNLNSKPFPSSKPYSSSSNRTPRDTQPQPSFRAYHRPYPQTHSLPQVKEEVESTTPAPSRQNSLRWPWKRSLSDRSASPDSSAASLSRATSSASMASTASTAVSSVFSSAPSDWTASTSYTSSIQSNPFYSSEDAPTLETLPFSVLENIFTYVLCLPLTVSIGPQESEKRHMQYRYHRAGLDYMDIQLVLKHPIFLVSHHLREVALDVFYRRCDFVVDLHRIYHTKVSSTVNSNLRRHQKFWLSETPRMVRDSLRKVSRLHIRLPVPSTETLHRSRDEDNWMDGSDGKGGGSWKVKSLKREQEDAMEVGRCLEAIKDLAMTNDRDAIERRPHSRNSSRSPSLRRTRSTRSIRSKSTERQSQARRKSSPDVDDEDGKRKPLKRLEIVLVKRSSSAMVLPETLGFIRTMRSVPVSGFTKYYFELDSQKVLWATKYKKKWQGMEPDGPRLLNDLQGLTVAAIPIEPICTPTEFQFVKASKRGQPRLQLSDSALPKTPIVLEKPTTAEKTLTDVQPPPTTSKAVRRKPLPWSLGKSRKRADSFEFIIDEGMDEVGSSGTTSGRDAPPTVEELRKIAEDIRNGLY